MSVVGVVEIQYSPHSFYSNTHLSFRAERGISVEKEKTFW
jgi:hypothetical protein